MCGIYGILSSAAGSSPPDIDSFLGKLNRLLKIPPADPRLLEPPAAELLEDARRDGYRFIHLDGFLKAICDSSLPRRLEEVGGALREWIRNLELHLERGGYRNQKDAEGINRLIVNGRDLAWQIERDILGNSAPVRDLLGGEAAGDSSLGVWTHGWKLNLVLNGIDRLEVRGRDSAGLAVYAHFRDGESLDRFLEQEIAGGPLAEQLGHRSSLSAFSDHALLRPEASRRTLLFAYKVANEVGEMGDNVRNLRRAIARDAIFQRALRTAGLELQVLAHTRWASNGVVSLQNCHPVDSTVYQGESPLPGSRGSLVAVLNGDVDNYQELYRRYVLDLGFKVEEGITTDAKIIPVVIGHHYRKSRSLEQAFRAAFEEFEGSMAIGVMAADRPGEFLFGQKGSGQGLYLGFVSGGVAVASEMYGLVELTQDYLKAEGDKVPGGEVFRIREGDGRVEATIISERGEGAIPRERRRQAEITTRDIDRGEYPRFLLKEISESVETVRKTIRGKFEADGEGKTRFLLGPEVLDPERVEEFRRGKIRRIVVIGQGTAAIAGEGIASLLRKFLADAPSALEITGMKATELSGHHLREDMADTLVIAVSQSGTTTDTNRTVDMARARGAWVIGIVNRRNSDLVYKSHGVLYTSDGRDIEMSVASTKAFYAQNVAGLILALALAEKVGTLAPDVLKIEMESLAALPGALQATLSLGDQIRELAERHGARRRYWAVVGSGAGKIAADEVRIKLSELCYKSIAVDYLEDKKHIDLSSEPLVLVVASGIPRTTVSDAIKEVSIFKAHQSIPLVIADEGEDRFDPYAAGVVRVPALEGALSYLLPAMVGHLFGFHAATAFDRFATQVRSIRTGVIREFQMSPVISGESGEAPAEFSAFSNDLIDRIRAFQNLLLDGALDGCLTPGTAVKLSLLFQFILGRIPAEQFSSKLGHWDTAAGIFETLIGTLTAAINELSRPIDAIKHQAKTVTVGISRTEEEEPEGALWSVFHNLKLDPADLSESHRAFLSAFEPLVARVEGATLYRVEDLDAVGRPREGSTIHVERKLGCAAKILSRSEEKSPLAGTKWGVARLREVHLGLGQADGRKILIVPVIGERPAGSILLFHLELSSRRDHKERLRALSAHRTLLERLRIAVTERNQVWDPSLLERVDNDTLFFEDPARVAEEIISQKAMR